MPQVDLVLFNAQEILFDIFDSNEISQDMLEASVATLMRSRIGVIDEINGDPSSWLKAIPLQKGMYRKYSITRRTPM